MCSTSLGAAWACRHGCIKEEQKLIVPSIFLRHPDSDEQVSHFLALFPTISCGWCHPRGKLRADSLSNVSSFHNPSWNDNPIFRSREISEVMEKSQVTRIMNMGDDRRRNGTCVGFMDETHRLWWRKEHSVGVLVKQCSGTFPCGQPALFYCQITQKCIDIPSFGLLTAAII